MLGHYQNKGKPCLVIADTAGLSPKKMEEWRWKAIEEVREKLIEEEIAVFSTPKRAAKSIKRMEEYYKYIGL